MRMLNEFWVYHKALCAKGPHHPGMP